MATTGGSTCHECGNRISYGKELALVQVSETSSETEPHCLICFLKIIIGAGEVLILTT